MTAHDVRPPADDGPRLCPAADPFMLADANINPVTGLSTDYLNHFNEAAMLLEMIPVMPECSADLVSWRPLTYEQHFAQSHLQHRLLAIAAYHLVDPLTRSHFRQLCDAMNATVASVRDALLAETPAAAATARAEQAVAILKPLIARTSAVIHGFGPGSADPASVLMPQVAVDAVLRSRAQ